MLSPTAPVLSKVEGSAPGGALLRETALMRVRHMKHKPVISPQLRLWVCLLLLAVGVLVSLLHTTSTPVVQADPRVRQALTTQQTCSGVQPTPNFSEYYGSVLLDGEAAPAGTLVEAYSPRGDKVGCVQISVPGYYPYMRVYGEEGTTPGMRNNEEVTFRVGGHLATADPSPVIWINDWDQHEVNLTATSAAPCYDFDNSGQVDVADVMRVASRWRTSCEIPDPDNNPKTPNYDSLYDIDDNCIINIVDIMLVVAHWGESC